MPYCADSWDEGYKSYIAGIPISSNPYRSCNEDHHMWNLGWKRASADHKSVFPV